MYFRHSWHYTINNINDDDGVGGIGNGIEDGDTAHHITEANVVCSLNKQYCTRRMKNMSPDI